METRGASKRKSPSESKLDGRAAKNTQFKKPCFRDTAELNKAVDSSDISAVVDILVNKGLKFPESTLNAALLRAVDGGKKQIVRLLLSHGACTDKESETACSVLLAAVEHKYLDIVKELVKKGVPVDIQNVAGKTPLMLAVEKSCCIALTSFLVNCADIDLKDNRGKTALMLAVEQWDCEVVQKLLSCGCDEDIKDNNGNTAFELAQKNGFAGLLNVLKESDTSGYPALYEAAKGNDLNLVRQLLQFYPSCVQDYPSIDSPLAHLMHGDDSEWDGQIHCSFEMMELLLKARVKLSDTHFVLGFTPLMYAAWAGSERATQILLQHGADVSERGPKDQTPLWMAASRGHASVVKVLIKAGAYTSCNDASGQSPLEVAIKAGSKACIQALLIDVYCISPSVIVLMREHEMLDALLDVKDIWQSVLPKNSIYSRNPQYLHMILFYAIQVKSYHLVKALINYGVDVNWCYTYGEDAFWGPDLGVDCGESACPLFSALNDNKMLQIMLDAEADVNIRHKSTGYTALMHAAAHGNLKHVRLLLECRADMYAESKGWTALSLACKRHNQEVVSALLDAGMDVNYLSLTKETALWHSLQCFSYEDSIIELLIRRGANVNFAYTTGVTVLEKAVKTCPANIVEVILKNGADVNTQDRDGNTALFHALGIGIHSYNITQKKEKASLLLQYGANVDHINLSMTTPLMVAVKDQDNNLVEVLLAREPVPILNAQDVAGDTALHIAVKHSAEDNLRTLVSLGADINIVNAVNRSPLMVAVKNLEVQMVKALLSLGADFSFQDLPDVRQVWQADLESLFKSAQDRPWRRHYMYHLDSEREYSVSFMDCMKHLLEAGCSLHHQLQNCKLDVFVGMCIVKEKYELVQLLLKSGVGPKTLDLTDCSQIFPINFIINSAAIGRNAVSPMYTAIFLGKTRAITLFTQACFYHQSDIKMLQHPRTKAMLQELVEDSLSEDPPPLEELCPENWSLRTWSKLAVLRAVGYGEGREHRVRALPIPQGLQDELLCKHISVDVVSPLSVTGISYGTYRSDSDSD
ncbi:ankyrin repeat protein [Elysia marginata]|uniref:Ankyrin repeat protein n=1 Tax=Elysia marginata TaxID=1093978 RepID=A0AAV4GRW1_9GAST|nr:ankyrin repeat protein [Elysia marginata]